MLVYTSGFIFSLVVLFGFFHQAQKIHNDTAKIKDGAIGLFRGEAGKDGDDAQP